MDITNGEASQLFSGKYSRFLSQEIDKRSTLAAQLEKAHQ